MSDLMPDAMRIIAVLSVVAERQRQIDAEGWTPDHDDQHTGGELAGAASAYAMSAAASIGVGKNAIITDPPPFFQFAPEWWKPRSPREDLIRAAALIIAEIERLDRAEAKTNLAQKGH